MYSEEFYRVALQFVEGYGNATLKKMLRLSGNATEFFEHPEIWREQMNSRKNKFSIPKITEAMRRLVDTELKLMARDHIQLCLCVDGNYPYRLKRCNDSPLAFFYKGTDCFNDLRMLALVGTREASEYGRNCVRKLLSDLRDCDITTVSGLAYGVDTIAHSHSLEMNMRTVAVLGNGFNTVYPQSNARLALQIIEHGGALISEYTYYTNPDRLNFPKRNRIIAGMSDAIIVIETANKGGSMITANIAQSYNRDVFAVPGTIFDTNHDGCHELIRNNVAAILYSGQHLVEMMNWRRQTPRAVQTALFVELNEAERRVVETIRAVESMSVDAIADAFPDRSPSKLAGLLLSLELRGVLTCKPGKVYTLNAF